MNIYDYLHLDESAQVAKMREDFLASDDMYKDISTMYADIRNALNAKTLGKMRDPSGTHQEIEELETLKVSWMYAENNARFIVHSETMEKQRITSLGYDPYADRNSMERP